MDFSPQQRDVIDFAMSGTGSLNLLAAAGCGKTTTLIEVVKYLPGSVWFCAFNRAIVSEIEYKVQHTSGINLDNIRVSTVHSCGMRVYSKHVQPRKIRVEARKVQGILDELAEVNEVYVKNQAFLRKLVEYAKSAGFGVLKRIGNVPDWLELIDHFGMDLDEEDGNRRDLDKLVSCAIVVYQKSLKLCSSEIDFSDMLLAPLYYEARFPKYDNILIDEAQDISPLRLKLILECLKPGGRVIAVGDEFQSIYGFCGASEKSMEDIKEHTNAVELPLTVTYRCPKSVVKVAQQWVPMITAHESAPEGIVREVWLSIPLAANNEPAKPGFWACAPFTHNDAVLCRNTKPLVSLAYDCLRRSIPCMVEGRDIGQGLVKLAMRWKLTTLAQLEVRLAEYKLTEIAKFESMKQEYKAAEIEDRCDTLQVLIECSQDQGGTRIQDLVDLIGRMFGDTLEGQKPKVMILSTVHKAKGREWQRVFILGREKYMPSKWAKQRWMIQQEQNLMYIAVTRAQRELVDVNVPAK
jgi:DNA helicase-2/ATP-dependent DNA helicase PcrA